MHPVDLLKLTTMTQVRASIMAMMMLATEPECGLKSMAHRRLMSSMNMNALNRVTAVYDHEQNQIPVNPDDWFKDNTITPTTL